MPPLRRQSSFLNIRAKDLKSLTAIQTRVNTHKNGGSDAGSPSSSPTSLKDSPSGEVEKCTCCPKDNPSQVRFTHPSASHVIEPKQQPKRTIRFAEPLTNIVIPLTEKERQELRELGRLPGTAYRPSNGPICEDVALHYSRSCDCFYPDDVETPEPLESESENGFVFKGTVYSEQDVAPGSSQLVGSKASRVLGLTTPEDEEEWYRVTGNLQQ